MRNLHDWREHDPLSAAHLQETVDAVRSMMAREQQPFRDYATYSPVLVKVTSAASGGGKYNGRILDGASNAAATGDLAMPEGMTVPTDDDCLVLNLSDNGTASHSLALLSYASGLLVGTTTAGLRVVAVSSGNGGSGIVVRVVSTATGAGKYNAFTQTVSMSSNPATDLTMPESMADNESVLLINATETADNTGTHLLLTGQYVMATFSGTATDGRRTVVTSDPFPGSLQDGSSPGRWVSLNVISPLKITPNGTTFGAADLEIDGGYSGSITTVTAVSYDTTSHILKFTSRSLTFTSGVLTTVGSTSDTTIDTAVSCT